MVTGKNVLKNIFQIFCRHYWIAVNTPRLLKPNVHLRCCKSEIVVIYNHHCNFSSRVVDMGMQLASGVNDTGGQFAADIKGSLWYILSWDGELTLLELLVIWER